MEFTCEQCGTVGECFPSQMRRFCSLSCRSRWQAVNRPHALPRKPRRGETVPCEVCGDPVYRQKSQTNKRFCSRACQAAGSRNGSEKQCEHCGKSMYVTPSMQSDRFCSRQCYETDRVKASGIGRSHNGREVLRDHSGYLRIWEPDHPAASQGRVLEHRWLVEQAIGRRLASDEHVHHVNGVKDDNRLENLEVMDAQEHRLLTAAEIKTQREADAAELAEYRRRFGPLT